METNKTSNGVNSVRALRNMWTSKAQEQEMSKTAISSRSGFSFKHQQRQSITENIPTLQITHEVDDVSVTSGDSPHFIDGANKIYFEPKERIVATEGNISLPIVELQSPTVENNHGRPMASFRKSTVKLHPDMNKSLNIFNKSVKQSAGLQKWRKTRLVCRSGLIFNRIRRASDSIVPLLVKTYERKSRPRLTSTASISSLTPFETSVDYLVHRTVNDDSLFGVPRKITRSASAILNCKKRNQLDDSIFQYEMILRHLKNYDQFTSQYPVSLSSATDKSKQRQTSIDNDPGVNVREQKEKFFAQTLSTKRQTQSLSRNMGRTFSEFLMNDLFLQPSNDVPTTIARKLSHAASQTDLCEPMQNNNDAVDKPEEEDLTPILAEQHSPTKEQVTATLNELETVLDIDDKPLPVSPEIDIHVTADGPSHVPKEDKVEPIRSSLMQQLFEGKKTAFSPDGLNMEAMRLPPDMLESYNSAKARCFFESEKPLYVAKMIKVSRKGYKQHMRMFCITTERIYNLTKKNTYPKEGLLFRQLVGITCTPYKDGFICIHTKDAYDDRGDWLIIVDHPCELITQLFMAIGRDNNDDNFLKIESQFTHCRRYCGEASSIDCKIKTQTSDNFYVKKTNYDSLTIYTP